MKKQWESGDIARNWVHEQGTYGDAWRVALVNPLALEICESLARGGSAFDFSAFEALNKSCAETTSNLRTAKKSAPKKESAAGVHVVDFGCGEGCLGRWLTQAGAGYSGFDSSKALVMSAKERGLSQVFVADLEARTDAVWHTLTTRLATIDSSKMLVTSIIVLDHMEAPERLMGRLGRYLSEREHDVPVLVVTLDASRLDPSEKRRHEHPSGWSRYEHKARIEAITKGSNEVDVYLYSRAAYERMFRDAGFFVRACEPLHFGGRHTGTPSGHDDFSRLPTFWAWRLSARHVQLESSDTLATQLRDVLSPHVAELYERLTNITGGISRVKFFQVAHKHRIIHARNLGGELIVLLEGSANLHGGNTSLSFGPGDILGELEAAGNGTGSYFPHDVLSGPEGCKIAILHQSDVDAILTQETGIGNFLYKSLRDRLQLVVWRHGVDEVRGDRGKRSTHPKCLRDVGPQYLWRAARALLWAAAIERRTRGRRLIDDVALLKSSQVGSLFHPSAQDPLEIRKAFRLFQFLRLVDALPVGLILTKDTDSYEEAGEPVADAVRRTWKSLVMRASDAVIKPHLKQSDQHGWLTDYVSSTALLEGQPALEKDAKPTSVIKEIGDAVGLMLNNSSAAQAALEHYKRFLVRAHAIWKDNVGTYLFFVLRDVPALQQIALGTPEEIARVLVARAEYIGMAHDAAVPGWEAVVSKSAPRRKWNYVEQAARFLASDLEASLELRWSDEMENWRASRTA